MINDQVQISVIIPTYNRADDLECCLVALSRQTFYNFETIIVDNGCTDGSTELLRKYKVKTIKDVRRNVTHLFNVGWQKSSADIVVFTNDDAEPEKDWLQNIIDTFNEYTDAGAVGGPTVLPANSLNNQEMLRLHSKSRKSISFKIPAWIYEKIILEGKYRDIGVLCESGGYSVGGSLYESTKLNKPVVVDLLSITNVAIKRSVLERVNGLDENFIFTHGDGDLFIRIRGLGYKLIFNPKAIVWHHVNPAGDTRAAFWRGRDHAYFLKKCVRPKRIEGRLKLFINILFFNIYWVYKSIEKKDPVFLKGISGFFQGIRDFNRLNSR
jgi:GT2 family glycosyltransferase